MKNLKMSDLTPEIMSDLMNLSSPEDVIAYFKTKDFEIGRGSANKILSQIKKASAIGERELAAVSGGSTECFYDTYCWTDCEWDTTCLSKKHGGSIS